jgi:hypothetical protein
MNGINLMMKLFLNLVLVIYKDNHSEVHKAVMDGEITNFQLMHTFCFMKLKKKKQLMKLQKMGKQMKNSKKVKKIQLYLNLFVNKNNQLEM